MRPGRAIVFAALVGCSSTGNGCVRSCNHDKPPPPPEVSLTGATMGTQVGGSVNAPAFPPAVEVHELPPTMLAPPAPAPVSNEPEALPAPPTPPTPPAPPTVADAAPEPEPSEPQQSPPDAGVSPVDVDAGASEASAAEQGDAERAQQPPDSYVIAYPIFMPVPAGRGR
jgi:hypothetical protein